MGKKSSDRFHVATKQTVRDMKDYHAPKYKQAMPTRSADVGYNWSGEKHHERMPWEKAPKSKKKK